MLTKPKKKLNGAEAEVGEATRGHPRAGDSDQCRTRKAAPGRGAERDHEKDGLPRTETTCALADQLPNDRIYCGSATRKRVRKSSNRGAVTGCRHQRGHHQPGQCGTQNVIGTTQVVCSWFCLNLLFVCNSTYVRTCKAREQHRREKLVCTNVQTNVLSKTKKLQKRQEHKKAPGSR